VRTCHPQILAVGVVGTLVAGILKVGQPIIQTTIDAFPVTVQAPAEEADE
jgi:hypothetical protein